MSVPLLLRRFVLPLLVLGSAVAAFAAPPETPAVDPETGVVHSRRLASGVPLGGIGAGTFQVMTDGSISQATITNNWNQPTGDLPGCFVGIRTRAAERTAVRILALKSTYGLPVVAGLDYEGFYPQATLT